MYVELGKVVERLQNSEGVEERRSEMELRLLRAKLNKMIKSFYKQEIESVVTKEEVKKAYMTNVTAQKSSKKTISISTLASPPSPSLLIQPL